MGTEADRFAPVNFAVQRWPGSFARADTAADADRTFVAAGLAASVVVPLVYLFAASLTLRFWHNPDEAQQVLVGLALVAAMPVAGSSTAWCEQADGDLALSLGLVLFSTLLSPLTTPMALHAAGAAIVGGYADALRGLAGSGHLAVFGDRSCVARHLGTGDGGYLASIGRAAVRGPAKVISAAGCSSCVTPMPQRVPRSDGRAGLDFFAVTGLLAGGMCLAAFAGGWAVARTLRADRSQSAALIYGLGMSNNGTGLVPCFGPSRATGGFAAGHCLQSAPTRGRRDRASIRSPACRRSCSRLNPVLAGPVSGLSVGPIAAVRASTV